MNFSKFYFLTLSSLFLLSACGPLESDIYTLYRNSATDSNMRLHIATFNSKDGHDYNMENCDAAKSLFQAQPGVTTRFWCEKGSFKK